METIKVSFLPSRPSLVLELLALPRYQQLHDASASSIFNLLTFASQNAANYVAESVQGGGAQASKEANKQVAKDGDASIGTRASAAKDAVSDKIDQSSHEGKADLHKGMPTSSNTYHCI